MYDKNEFWKQVAKEGEEDAPQRAEEESRGQARREGNRGMKRQQQGQALGAAQVGDHPVICILLFSSLRFVLFAHPS